MSDTSSAALEKRLAVLEGRLQQLEDENAIRSLIAAYGPLVDAGEADEVAALWTTDGVYDVEEMYLEGHDALRGMVGGEAHQGLIARGSAHFLGPAHVTVTGQDSARAVCHSVLVVHHKERFVVARAGVHHFTLTRTRAGWRIAERTTRLLDGGAEARALLAAGVLGPTGQQASVSGA